MVKGKSILTATIIALSLSACGNVFNAKLEVGKKLRITEISFKSSYEQNDGLCYVYNSLVIETIYNSQIYYSINGNEIIVKITGDHNYTFYHYAVETWGII